MDDMTQGYMDGRDLSAPTPSSNRSATYQHGFMIGRNEVRGQSIRADVARLLADQAIAEDENR